MASDRSDYQKGYRQQYKQRMKRVSLTLSLPEHRALTKAAGMASVASYAKQLVLAGLHQQAVIPDSLEDELSTLRFAVRNIANNVNQMAHYSHTVRSMTLAEENNLLQHLKQLDDAVHAFTEQRIMGASENRAGSPPDESAGHDSDY